MEKEPDNSVPPSDVELASGFNNTDSESNSPANVGQKVHPRADIASWKWILTCVVLYLGALLYGNYILISYSKDECHADISRFSKASTPPSPPTCKLKYTNHWATLRTFLGLD